MLIDKTGDQARRWIEGVDAGKPGRIAQRTGDAEAWRFLSQSSHVDSKGVRFITTPNGRLASTVEQLILLQPNRVPLHANALLHVTADEMTRLAVMVAEASGRTVEIPVALSTLLLAANQEPGSS